MRASLQASLTALVAAFLVAGCIQTNGPDAGQPSTPPTTAPTAPGGQGNGGNQGIAIGEPNPGAPGGTQHRGGSGGMLVRPAHNESTADGLHMVGDEDVSGFQAGGSATFRYLVTNEGKDHTIDNICVPPFSFALHDEAGQELFLEPPQAHCQALGFGPFPAGATYAFNTTWDGRVYDSEGNRSQAPAGRYFVTALFHTNDDAHASVSVTLPINVLEFSQGTTKA